MNIRLLGYSIIPVVTFCTFVVVVVSYRRKTLEITMTFPTKGGAVVSCRRLAEIATYVDLLQ